MKIVRIVLKVKNRSMYVERPYYDDKSDQQNCDAALQSLNTKIEKKEVIAVLAMKSEGTLIKVDDRYVTDKYVGAMPAYLNTDRVSFIMITDVSVFDVKED